MALLPAYPSVTILGKGGLEQQIQAIPKTDTDSIVAKDGLSRGIRRRSEVTQAGDSTGPSMGKKNARGKGAGCSGPEARRLLALLLCYQGSLNQPWESGTKIRKEISPAPRQYQAKGVKRPILK